MNIFLSSITSIILIITQTGCSQKVHSSDVKSSTHDVDYKLNDPVLRKAVHKAILVDYSYEDDGKERTIDLDRLDYRITTITLAEDKSQGLEAMEVTAIGTQFSPYDLENMTWDCGVILKKISGNWQVQEVDCLVEAAFD